MALGGLLCAGMGCTRHDTQPQQAPSATPSSSTSSRVRFVSQKRNDDAKEPVLSQQLQRRLKRRLRFTPVIIDGRPAGVMNHKELPSDVAHRTVMRGQPFTIYPLADYLTRLGANLEAIRSVHLIGGSRPAVITGQELRRMRKQVHFAFSRGDGGRPRMDWPEEHVKSSTRIDRIVAVHVYETKKPAGFDRQEREYIDAKGRPLEGLPHDLVMREMKGTRLYVDGRWLGSLRRRDLKDAFRGPDNRRGEATYYVADYLERMGSPAAPKHVVFVSGDRVVGRLDGAGYDSVSSTMRFTYPRRSRGQMLLRMTRKMSPFPGGVAVSAILIFDRNTPPPHPVERPRRRPSDAANQPRPTTTQ